MRKLKPLDCIRIMEGFESLDDMDKNRWLLEIVKYFITVINAEHGALDEVRDSISSEKSNELLHYNFGRKECMELTIVNAAHFMSKMCLELGDDDLGQYFEDLSETHNKRYEHQLEVYKKKRNSDDNAV